MRNRWVACATAMLLIGAAVNGCHDDTDCLIDGLDCNAFQPGTDMTDVDFGADFSIEGQVQAFAQATGNLSVVAGAALTNVTAACRNMAIDLGDDPTGGAGTMGGAKGKTGTDLLEYWCGEAMANLKAAAVASGSVTLSITPAKCSTSIVDATKCQSQCASDGGACASTLSTCAGGTIESTCAQGCSASNAPYDCVGACSGQCSGACVGTNATPVTCIGRCDGMCTAKSGLGDGPQSDGTCKGMCSGTCTLGKATVSCEGLCDGQCDGACGPQQAQGNAICSGNCQGSSQPISCSGGTLGGGCATDSDCQSNCNASAQAAALCTSASVVVSTSSDLPNDVTSMALAATVEKNFPAILLVVQGQGKAMATTMKNTIQGAQSIISSGKSNAGSNVCIVDMVAAAASANLDFAAALAGASDVSGAIGGPSAN